MKTGMSLLLFFSFTLPALGNSPGKVNLDSVDYYLTKQPYFDRLKASLGKEMNRMFSRYRN